MATHVLTVLLIFPRYFFIRFYKRDPFLESTCLDYILRGIKKVQINTTKKRFPITSDVLANICKNLEKGMFSQFIDLMLQCIFKMAFFGFLRCGEFTCNGNSQSILAIQDISFCPKNKQYSVHLQSSKCDMFHKGVNINIFENNCLQPVSTMSMYLEKRMLQGAYLASPLFIENEFDQRPLSRNTFLMFLKEALRRSGYNDSLFSGHSFRIGAATSAAAAGVEDHIIKTLGRWNSDCYMRYIREDQSILRLAQQDMCLNN